MTFMARQMGLYFLALSLVFAVHPVDGVSSMIYHPLITLGWFMFFCTVTIDNLHGLQLQDSDGPTPKHYKMTWIPQLIFGIGLCVIMLLTFVRVAPVTAEFLADGKQVSQGKMGHLLRGVSIIGLGGSRVELQHNLLHHHRFMFINDREQLISKGSVAPRSDARRVRQSSAPAPPLLRLTRDEGLRQPL